MAAYSFKDVKASIDGPEGNYQIGQGSGTAEEGITVERTEDRNTMTAGADGTIMHSMHVANHGTIRVRILKTSPTNGLLWEMLEKQRVGSKTWGINTITVQDHARGDKITATEVAFMGEPQVAFAKVGNVHEWSFHAGHIVGKLDTGQRPVAI
jgi:hypothetical protein